MERLDSPLFAHLEDKHLGQSLVLGLSRLKLMKVISPFFEGMQPRRTQLFPKFSCK